MPAAPVNGTTLHYEVDGDGPPCLVLHGGLGHDHQQYRRTLAPLARSLQLVFLDHRGNGRSGRPGRETLTMEQFADDAVALADHLDLDRVVVLGHSYGGFIAQELAIRHPARLDGLILVSTTPGQLGTGESADEHAGPPPPDGLREVMSAPPGSDTEYAAGMTRLLPYYFHTRTADDVAPLFAGTIHDVDAMVRGFELLATWSAVDRLSSITCPVLLLVGRHDVFTSYPQSLRIAQHLSDAEVAILEQSGHFPWIEEPEAFFAAVEQWRAAKVR